MPSIKRHDGELMIDNRASGDEPPWLSGMGTHFSVPTLSCRHCGGAWVVNPLRKRAREYCKVCDKYMCDTCYGVSKEPGYVHRTIEDLHEMLASGKVRIVGGTVCNPILVSTGVK